MAPIFGYLLVYDFSFRDLKNFDTTKAPVGDKHMFRDCSAPVDLTTLAAVNGSLRTNKVVAVHSAYCYINNSSEGDHDEYDPEYEKSPSAARPRKRSRVQDDEDVDDRPAKKKKVNSMVCKDASAALEAIVNASE